MCTFYKANLILLRQESVFELMQNKDEFVKTVHNMKAVVVKYVKEKHPDMKRGEQEKVVNGLMKKLRLKILKVFKKKLTWSPWKGKDDTYARMLR